MEKRKQIELESDREIDEILVLHSINKSKFSKKERTFILKQASNLIDLKNPEICRYTPLAAMFMSENT